MNSNRKTIILVVICIIAIMVFTIHLNKKQKVISVNTPENNSQSNSDFEANIAEDAKKQFEEDYDLIEKNLKEKAFTLKSLENIEDRKYNLIYIEGDEQKKTEVQVMEDNSLLFSPEL